MKVVITDDRYKMALAPLWSLKGAGYTVACGDGAEVDPSLRLACRSRFCDSVLTWSGEGPLAAQVAGACSPGDVVLPTGRHTLRSFASHPELSGRVRYLASPPEVLERADDKGAVAALAKSLGIPLPETLMGMDLAEQADSLVYPQILKYRDGEALGLRSRERYSVVRSPEEFRREHARMAARSPELLTQTYLQGRDVGAAVVMDRSSRPVDFLLYVSELEYPLSGGPTCLCRTVFDRQLLKYACSLLSALGFQGIAMLDFKGSPEAPFLLEINPRVWGSAALAAAAKATFFESYVRAALGEASPLDPETCRPGYRLGVRMKFTPQLFLASFRELRAGGGRRALSHLGAGLSPRVKDGAFRFADPKPGLRYLRNLAGRQL